MDELLASIRRIISQDEDETSESVSLAATGTEGMTAPAVTAEPAYEPEPEDEFAGLDLDQLPDLIEQSIREAFPEAPRAAAWDAAAMEAFSAALEEEDPEPTVSLWDDEGDDQESPTAGGFSGAFASDEDDPDDRAGFHSHHSHHRGYEDRGYEDSGEEGVYGDAFAAAARAAPNVRRRDLDADRDEMRRLMSDRSSQSVGSAFDELARSMHTTAGPRVAAGTSAPARSLEDVVQDCLRPMLQAWLDENLPDLVERMVQQEIDRVARKPR